MIKININKDITEYSEGVAAGITLKEIGRLLAAAVIAIILIFLFSMIMPLIFAIYLAMPAVAMVLLSGKKIGNISAKEMVKYYPVYKAMKNGVVFKSTENITLSEQGEMLKEVQNVKENIKTAREK